MGMTLNGGVNVVGSNGTFSMGFSGTGGGTPTGTVYLRIAVTGPGVNTTTAWKSAGTISSGVGSGGTVATVSGFIVGGTYTWSVQGSVGSQGPAAYAGGGGTFTVTEGGGGGGGGDDPPDNRAPTASVISPTNGANIGTLDPDFVIGFYDPDRGDPEVPGYLSGFGYWAAYQIQVEQPAGTLKWDSGKRALPSGASPLDSQITVNYGGSALSAAVAARVRARVWDAGFGGDYPSLSSSYTGWRTFTPQSIPDPPTLTAFASPTNTLTPVIKGTYNAGSSLGTEDEWRYEIRDGGVVTYDSGWIDGAIATGQTYGTANDDDTPSTPPALQWGKLYSARAKSKDSVGGESDWSAARTLQMNRRPTTPTGLQPSGGAITGDPSPTLVYQHNDPDGDAQTKATVDLYEVATGERVSGYPKELTQSATSHVVDAVLSTSPPTTYAWRVKTEGAANTGGYSDYSDPAEFIVASAPPVEITSPLPDAILDVPSFTVTWDYEGDLGPQATWRVVVRDGLGDIVHDTGQVAGEDESYTVPSGVLRNLSPYTVTVYVTDTNDRPAQSSRVPISTMFTPPDPITGLVATVIGGAS